MLDRFPPFALVALGGMFGAIARYWISGYYRNSDYPYGTLIVNILGSGMLGFLVTLYSLNVMDNNWLLLLGTGFMGSMTTMSTFVVETMRLGENAISLSFTNILGTLLFVFLSAYIGQALAIYYVNKGAWLR
ncbi:MAG: fluoride efflux transporter CrcB [Candidatus Heimdallarchaeota archaeon]